MSKLSREELLAAARGDGEVRRERDVLAAALRAGCRATAVDDLLSRAREANIQGDAAGLDRWVEGLRPSAAHLFIPSTGAGASGSRAPLTGDMNRAPFLSPEEFGSNAEKIAAGKPIR
jgi:hypothetical protein